MVDPDNDGCGVGAGEIIEYDGIAYWAVNGMYWNGIWYMGCAVGVVAET